MSREGLIRQVHLTGARLLNVAQAQLIGRRLGLLAATEDGPAFDSFIARRFEGRVLDAHGFSFTLTYLRSN